RHLDRGADARSSILRVAHRLVRRTHGERPRLALTAHCGDRYLFLFDLSFASVCRVLVVEDDSCAHSRPPQFLRGVARELGMFLRGRSARLSELPVRRSTVLAPTHAILPNTRGGRYSAKFVTPC